MPFDKQKIEFHIKEWLMEHSSLLVPNLGQFDAVYKSAVVFPSIHHLLPPSKEITFYPSAKHNDGLFENFLSEENKMPLSEVETKLKQYVTALKIELGAQRRYAIQGLGQLVLNPQDVMEFHQAEDANLLGDAFGLPNLLQVKPLVENIQPAEPEEDIVIEMPDFSEDDNQSGKISFPVWRYAAVATLVFGASTGVWYLSRNPSALGSLNPNTWFSAAPTEEKTSPKDTVKTSTTQDTNTTKDPVTTDSPNKKVDTGKESQSTQKTDKKTSKSDPEKTYTASANTEQSSIQVPSSLQGKLSNNLVFNPQTPANLAQVLINKPMARFFVVAASFGDQRNAYSFYNNLVAKGFKNPKIISPNGQNKLYRVTIADYGNKKQAQDNASAYEKQFQENFWILEF